MCHYSNLSYRLGQPASVAACQAALGSHPPVAGGFPRLVKSLEGIGLDLAKTPFTLGPWLALNPASGELTRVRAGNASDLEAARRIVRSSHRAPYMLPA